METYIKTDILQHQHPEAFKTYTRCDMGKFDICRECPLKLAVLALRRNAA